MTGGTSADAIRLLRRQFDFTSPELTLARYGRLGRLLADLDPSQSYPADWLIFRLTGVAPEASSDAMVFAAVELLAPLVDLIETLHRRLGPFAFDPETDVDAGSMAAELGVSRRTFQRWRHDGLPMLRFRHEDGRSRVGCRRRHVESFLRRHPDRVEDAAHNRRIEDDERTGILRAFASARATGISITAAIDRVAAASGRSPNAVRALVRTAGGDDTPRQSTRHGSADQRRRFAHRAVERTIPIPQIAARLVRSDDAVRRLDLEERRRRVRDWPAPTVRVPNLERPEAAEVFAAAGTIDGLARELAGATWGAWLDGIRLLPAGEDDERARGRIAAMHFAHARAHQAVTAIATQSRPGFRGLDPIESDLRWWGLLLERSTLRGVAEGLRRLEQTIGRRIEDLPKPRRRPAIELVLATVADVVSTFDPTRRAAQHTLDRAVALGVGRRLARESAWGTVAGALARGGLEEQAMIDTLTLVPEPARSLLAVERWWRASSPEDRALIASSDGGRSMVIRFGLTESGRPRTLLETGRSRGIAPTRLIGSLEEAMRAIRASAMRGWRSSSPSS
jgi:hypothetical protein